MRGRAARHGPSERPRGPGPDRQRRLRVRLLHGRAALPPEPRPRAAARPAACCRPRSSAAFPLSWRPSASVRLRPSPPSAPLRLCDFGAGAAARPGNSAGSERPRRGGRGRGGWRKAGPLESRSGAVGRQGERSGAEPRSLSNDGSLYAFKALAVDEPPEDTVCSCGSRAGGAPRFVPCSAPAGSRAALTAGLR